MAVSVKNPETDHLARELTAATGESITEAVTIALRERLERVRGRRAPAITRRLQAFRNDVSSYPVEDPRPTEEIITYDERGLPA